MSEIDRRIRLLGMWCHLSILPAILIGFVLPIPFVGAVVPYLVWQNQRKHHPFVDSQGKEALNFQLSMTLYSVAAVLLFTILLFQICGLRLGQDIATSVTARLCGRVLAVELGLFAGLLLFQFIVVAIAAIQAYRGQRFRYPITFRFVK